MAVSARFNPAERQAIEDSSDQDWRREHQAHVCDLTYSGAAGESDPQSQVQFLNTVITAMTELQSEQAGQCGVLQNASDEVDWRDTLTWDLNGVLHLRRVLALWAECKVPASDIGLFLVKILYQRDDHLGNRLTRMVNLNESYTDIALAIMKHYQIRDSDDQLVWTLLELGETELRPSETCSPRPSTASAQSMTTGNIETTASQEPFHTAPSSPDLPPRWPFYVKDADLEDFFLNSPKLPCDEICRQSFDGHPVKPADLIDLITVLGATDLQVAMENTDLLPEPMAGDIVDSNQSSPNVSARADALQTQDTPGPGSAPVNEDKN